MRGDWIGGVTQPLQAMGNTASSPDQVEAAVYANEQPTFGVRVCSSSLAISALV